MNRSVVTRSRVCFQGFMAEESLSLDETNKLRAALGLKPLAAPSASATGQNYEDTSSAGQDQRAYENWRKEQDSLEAAKEKAAALARIEKSKKMAARFERLEGRGLADDDDEETDVRQWVIKTKKIKKRKLDETPEELHSTYNEESLSGLRVGHDIGDFDTNATILTLKDASVLKDASILEDQEEDQLESLKLVEKERTQKNLNRKNKTKSGDTTEQDGKGILSKYDEEEEPKFMVLGETALEREVVEDRRGTAISLDVERVAESSDYMDTTIRKSKKKRPKSIRVKGGAEGDDISFKPQMLTNREKSNIADDEELQAALSRQRRIAQKRHASIVRPVKDIEAYNEDLYDGGMVFDEATGFLSGIRPVEKAAYAVKEEPLDRVDIKMEIKQDPNELLLDKTSEDGEDLIEEPGMGHGLGAALKMLQQRGVVDRASEETTQKLEQQRQNMAWLAEKRRKDALREAQLRREKIEGREKMKNMSARERERTLEEENRRRTKHEAAAEFDKFKEFKPDVHLHYKDEFGRDMTPKEAFRQMSHQFHGKGSGVIKSEKRLKRIQEEQEREKQAMASGVFASSGVRLS